MPYRCSVTAHDPKREEPMTNLTKRAMADALKKLLQKRKLEHITVQDVAIGLNYATS